MGMVSRPVTRRICQDGWLVSHGPILTPAAASGEIIVQFWPHRVADCVSLEQVEPFSVKHKYDGKYDDLKPELKTCNPGTMKFVTAEDEKQEVKEHSEIIFTYDVTYKVPHNPRFCLPQGNAYFGRP